MSGDTLAILVGGGPAPGINSVIASATIEAINSGLRVVGLYDGYRHIAQGKSDRIVELTLDSVETVHTRGGSILRTSRTNPAKDEATLQNCVKALGDLNVRYLVAIGGDDTTYGATQIAKMTQGKIGVATVPKTIDNDLPLPDNAPTFGFETARSVATNVVESLLEDARTTERWYIVIGMGRKSGALALGMCKSAGATLAVIPEEFPEGSIDLALVVDAIAGSITKRKAMGHSSGVAVVAEGIAERLAPEQLEKFQGLTRDSYGHIRLADVPLGAVLRDALRDRLKELDVDIGVVPKDIGYELRCAKPVPFDVEYTRTLGYGAVRYLLEGGSGSLIALSGGRVTPLTLEQLQDPQTGRVRVRMVDTDTESYRVGRYYQTRIEKSDLQGDMLAKLAAQTNLSPETFAQQFSQIP